MLLLAAPAGAQVLGPKGVSPPAAPSDPGDYPIGGPPVAGTCDVVLVLEALHDMAHPVGALAAARACLADDGCVVVLDEAVADEFVPPPPGEVGPVPERLFYASSVLPFLPVGLSEDDSAGTGAVMRPATLRAYAAEAGFTDVRDGAIEHDLLRCYVLRR